MMMRSLVLGFIVLVAIPEISAAQTPTHPTDSTAVYIGSYDVSVEYESLFASASAMMPSLPGTGTCIIEEHICVWATTAGIDLVGDMESIVIDGDNSVIDNLPTHEIVSLLSRRAVEQRNTSAQICATDCEHPASTRILHRLCVARVGTGASTHYYHASSPSYSTRTYACCETVGIHLVSASSIECSAANCESTAEGGAYSFGDGGNGRDH